MPARMRPATASQRQTRDRLETAQSVAAVDDMSGEEGSGAARESRSPKKQRLNTSSPARTRDATNTLEAARHFECPACEAAEHPRVTRMSSPCEAQPLSKVLQWTKRNLQD